MSIHILPYSVEEFNKIPDLAVSVKKLFQWNGESFLISTIRLLLLEHGLTDTFGVQLLHSQFSLRKDEKLVEFNYQATGWDLKNGDELMGGRVVPTSWRLITGKGLMPYEFEFLPLSTDRGFDLTMPKYQAFLKDFVDACEAAQLHDTIALTTRPKQPAGMKTTQRKTNIFFPEGTYEYDPKKTVVVGWYFNLRPTDTDTDALSEEPILRSMCWSKHRVKRHSTGGMAYRLRHHTDHEEISHYKTEDTATHQLCNQIDCEAEVQSKDAAVIKSHTDNEGIVQAKSNDNLDDGETRQLRAHANHTSVSDQKCEPHITYQNSESNAINDAAVTRLCSHCDHEGTNHTETGIHNDNGVNCGLSIPTDDEDTDHQNRDKNECYQKDGFGNQQVGREAKVGETK
ncbi:hypothetical protein H2198_004330 [Neophaeococcomyces mojaviensis]|uniref:Uncharacterized protein n=1 Tax=Neophaeococcomyces mojaviensis TaxID=3383035 RepID=A0ACC3A921_9EURO|nr:hypothetical protein H2198_004330 [Knufia sp. JES_112]